jgi:hypothetical protein
VDSQLLLQFERLHAGGVDYIAWYFNRYRGLHVLTSMICAMTQLN